MQTPCPKCGNRIVIDDAKVPDRPFQVKCPKCQTVAKFPGKAAAETGPEEPVVAAPDASSPAPAQVRREVMGAEGQDRRALVSIADRTVAGAIMTMLSRVGYTAEPVEDAAEGGRLLEQGAHDILVTTRTVGGPGKPETIYQRLSRLSPDTRRRLFIVLVGDEFKTGDGTQAWVSLADLVVHTKDVGSAENVLWNTMGERSRIYQIFNEARRRHDASAS